MVATASNSFGLAGESHADADAGGRRVPVDTGHAPESNLPVGSSCYSMATQLVSSLEGSLSGVDVTSERVPRDGVREAVVDAVDGPAVAVPLDDYDASLDETRVTVDPTPSEVRAAATGVTPAAFGVADYGTVVLPQDEAGSELVSLFVERHVAVLRESDVVPDMEAAFDRLDGAVPEEYGDAVLATGPSATADMGELVEGAHGPREVHVVVVEGE